jgi:hypothetical protein
MSILERVKRGRLAGLAIPPEIYCIAGIDVPLETTDDDRNKIASKIRRNATMCFWGYVNKTYEIEYRNGPLYEEEIPGISIEFYKLKRYKNCIDKTDGDSTEYTDFYSGFVDGAQATDSAAKRAGNEFKIRFIYKKMEFIC